MKKINKRDLIIYIVIFAITLIIFLPLLMGHYASDSYNIYNIGYHNYAIEYSLNDGRIFMAIIGLMAEKINISLNVYIFITLFCALIISNISVILLNKIIKKYKEPKNFFQEVIVIIISYITIFNFMYLENMYFVECIVMATSILLFLISADILVEKNNKYFIKSLILTIIGIMFYQGTIGMLFTFVFLFTILKNKNNVKQIVIDFLQSGIIGGTAVFLNLVIVKIIGNALEMEQSRYGSLSNIFTNIKYILLTFSIIIKKNCGLFPKNLLLVFLAILSIIVIAYQIKNREKKDNIILKYILIIIIAIAASYIVNLTTLTSINTGRLKNPLGALVGIIFILLYVETDLLENKRKLSKLTILTLLSFAIINAYNYENIIMQHKVTNILEKAKVKEIEEYIEKYEEDTQVEVTKIAKIPIINSTSKAYFAIVKNRSVYAHNSLRTYWSSDGVMNLYTDRNLETVTLSEKERKCYIENQDEERGYECIGDTLYINTYIN